MKLLVKGKDNMSSVEGGRHRMNHRGHIEVIVGSMFSGKSEELIRRSRRAELAKQGVQVFKPNIDNRYGTGSVNSHSNFSRPAIEIATSHDVIEFLASEKCPVHVVGIDEAQFLDDEIIAIVNYLADKKKMRVISAGLDTDFRGEPFGPMPALMAEADIVDKLHAICVKCGEDASRTQRMIKEMGVDGTWQIRPAGYFDPLVVVAAGEDHAKKSLDRIEYYEARCRHCHEVPGKPETVVYQAA